MMSSVVRLEWLMKPQVRISRTVLAELSQCLAERSPVLSTDRGDLFLPEQLPVAAIRLRIPAMSYFHYIESLQPEDRPDIFRIVIVDDLPFHVVINGVVGVSNGRTTINGKQKTIL